MISKHEFILSLEIAATCEVSCISQVTLWGDLCELFVALFEEEFGTKRLPYDFFHHVLRACLVE